MSERDQQPTSLCSTQYHGLDTPERVCFYEQDFYVLSNFSAFRVKLLVDDGSGGEIHATFDTSEAAYHWFKFPHMPELQAFIRAAMSAHDAFKMAEEYKARRRTDWDSVKVDVMRKILRAKADQHEYVRRKLLQTGTRELVENSWRDNFWGWGPNRDGQNMLGKLWMEIRAELREKAENPSAHVAAGVSIYD
jgi:N-glycosidase YbiA